MDNGLSEVVVLRPTIVFFSFLASQLGEDNLPSFKSLQTDNTAYLLKKGATQDDTLNELEQHFRKMFRHEICRWLGKDARNQIEKSFLDFLCCFKLEFHSHLIVLESSLKNAHNMLQLRPRAKLLQWLNKAVENEPELSEVMEQVNLSHLTENASVIIKNFNNLNEIKPFLERYYESIFSTAMSRITNDSQQWPKILSYQEFTRYFSIEIHTQLISYAA
ncbi:hypothetical protein [Legionella sp. km772]|uniref:hypothetical protein n=1 Tax=Legionella sp. km772 TaxID=2498111 RepID=UPI000F8CA501|nr:hypothetical protein [Legionella sp. km772]RUR11968.1 hypothetical protein ELY15_06595 [Legionella sp. km772]